MKTTLVLAVAIAAFTLHAADIPDRPEKLAFPTLKYEPPVAKDFRVQLKSGPVAYIVPDHERPLVNITIYLRTGKYLEPAGREGIGSLTAWLMAHGGAGTNSADQLEERLAYLGANLAVTVDDTQGTLNLNLLAKDLDEGLAILHDVLYTPRFQDDKITLRKAQILQAMQQRNDDSAAIEDREADFLSRGEKFWANRLSTSNSIAAITPDDLKKFHQQMLAPDCIIAISGDFDRKEMIARLETLFRAGLNPKTDKTTAIPSDFTFGKPGTYLVNKPDVNQARVTMMLPGITRDNPDYFACLIMNDILGGGGFTSRVMGRVRSDEGLAYSVYSSFPGGIYFPGIFTLGFQSKSRTAAYAAAISLEEIKRIADAHVSADELAVSKRAFIERFPRTFGTKDRIADQLAQDEFTGRYAQDPEFWKNFRANIQAVTIADVQRVAQKYLTPANLIVLIVGNEQDILLGHPNHPVDLKTLFGPFTELPLRDPMTLQPMK